MQSVQEDVALELDLTLAFQVQSAIAINAGCNQDGDHHVLAELVCKIAKKLAGLIDFGHDIYAYNWGPQQEFEGLIYELTHEHGAIRHIVDSSFFEAWLRNNVAHLRMVK